MTAAFFPVAAVTVRSTLAVPLRKAWPEPLVTGEYAVGTPLTVTVSFCGFLEPAIVPKLPSGLRGVLVTLMVNVPSALLAAVGLPLASWRELARPMV